MDVCVSPPLSAYVHHRSEEEERSAVFMPWRAVTRLDDFGVEEAGEATRRGGVRSGAQGGAGQGRRLAELCASSQHSSLARSGRCRTPSPFPPNTLETALAPHMRTGGRRCCSVKCSTGVSAACFDEHQRSSSMLSLFGSRCRWSGRHGAAPT